MVSGESSVREKKGVLIVDDHALMRVGLRSVLELQNDLVVVGEAGNGVQAVQLAKKLKPDIVIMDLIMPEKDGETLYSYSFFDKAGSRLERPRFPEKSLRKPPA